MGYASTSIVGQDFLKVTEDQEQPLGTIVDGANGNTYIYVQANGTITAGMACALTENGEVTPLTSTLSGAIPTAVVFPQAAMTDNYFGYAVKAGLSFNVAALANCAIDVLLYTSATAGSVDDASTNHDKISGLRINVAPGGSAGVVNASALNGCYTNG